MPALREWIRPEHLDPRAYAKAYRAAKPFPHAALTGFLVEKKAKALAAALRRQQFERKESDLFCFWQTGDLLYAKDPVLREFLDLLRSEAFSAWLRELTGERVSGKIDAMGALYKDTDYLLCHDDELENRKIAYVMHLGEGFTTRSGGALALLDADRNGKPRDVVKRISPSWNALTLFTVSERSHHLVEEVLEDKERISITGWFRG